MHRRERLPPRFPLELWNVNNRVEEEIPKTNNHVEAYHRHLQTAILSFHPNIWTSLKVLKREEALKKLEMIQMEAGQASPPQELRYVTVNLIAEYKLLLRTMAIEIPLAILENCP